MPEKISFFIWMYYITFFFFPRSQGIRKLAVSSCFSAITWQNKQELIAFPGITRLSSKTEKEQKQDPNKQCKGFRKQRANAPTGIRASKLSSIEYL